MKQHILILLTGIWILIFGLSCSKSEDQNYVIWPMWVSSVDIPDTVAVGQIIFFTVHSDLPTSCETYSNYTQNEHGHDINIALFMKHDVRERACFDVLTTVDVSGLLRPTNSGLYRFYFNQPDSSAFEYDVVVTP